MAVAWAMLRGRIWGRLLVPVAVVGLVVSAGCFGSGTGVAFDDDDAAELDAVVERGLDRTAAGAWWCGRRTRGAAHDGRWAGGGRRRG